MKNKLFLVVILAVMFGIYRLIFAVEAKPEYVNVKQVTCTTEPMYSGAPQGPTKQVCEYGIEVPTKDTMISVKSTIENINNKYAYLENQLNDLKKNYLPEQKKLSEIYITEQLKDIKAGAIEAALVEILSDPERKKKLLPLLCPQNTESR